ncbi:phage tail protein, partial [Paenibacillus ehimensis]
EFPDTLLARCQALLNEMKTPRTTYRVQAAELYRLTKDPIDRFRTGSMVRIQDAELGVDVTARVVSVRKGDLYGAPGDVEIEIANRSQDIAKGIADLANRQRINEVYAQGATNLDSHDFADNCDPQHPAILRLYIPEETARINKMRISYQVEPFRAYERAIESAPAVTSGPSSTSTTAAGGQTTSGPSSTSTTASGGQTTSGPSSTTTTASGGATTSGPSSASTTASGGGSVETSSTSALWDLDVLNVPHAVSYQQDHDHGISAGTVLIDKDGGWHVWVPSGGHRHNLTADHRHEVSIPPHTHGMDHTHYIGPHAHGMDHTHNIDAHVHGMDHTHQIDAHVHGMDHTHEIPAHTHGIEYGIFEGPTPSAVTVSVDGNVIPGLGTSAQDVDIIPYLAKDPSGKVRRGWREIKITPDKLGRIVANVNSQIFVRSQGGGDF